MKSATIAPTIIGRRIGQRFNQKTQIKSMNRLAIEGG